MSEHFDTASPVSAAPKRPLKVFLCHAHADSDPVPQGDDMCGLPVGTRLTPPALAGGAREDGVDAWFDKAKLHSERSRTILPGQGWQLEIRKAMREAIDV
jgi:hypothetical protein